MYSIDIEIEKVFKFLNKKPDLVKEINDTALILDQAGAPKEERYQKVLDYTSKLMSVSDDIKSSYGLIFYLLVTVFGLSQHFFQTAKSSVSSLFPGIKEYRNHGIREHNNYQREVTDKKIQDRLEDNLDAYIKNEGKDKNSQLFLDLEYLEKYRKVNCMKVAKEIIDLSSLDDNTSLNSIENKKAYEIALAKLKGV